MVARPYTAKHALHQQTTHQSPIPDLGALIERVADGDQSACTTLYDAISAVVYGLAFRILRDHSAAEDLTTEVYMQVHKQAAHFDGRRGTPLAWLTMITKSRARDRRRLERRRQQRERLLERAGFASWTATPEMASASRELHRLIHIALDRLSPAQRQVIEIAYFDGLSHTEIAAKLGQPLGTVKTRLRTGVQALRLVLRPLLAQGEC